MRASSALAFLCLAAVVPLTAQRAAPVRQGDGFEIGLPSRFREMPSRRETGDGFQMRGSIFATDNDREALVVLRFHFQEFEDTTLATRRAILQLTRVALLQAAGEFTAQGEPRDFERGDRVGLRVPIRMEQSEKCGCDSPGNGIAEISVARQGGPEIWMVMYVDTRSDLAAGAAAGERFLESFHLSGESMAMDRQETVREGGFVELTEIKSAKPKP